MKDWDYEVSDYLILMIDFLDQRISTPQYRRSMFEMAKKRGLMSDEAGVLIQRAYGDADDYDEVVDLPYTIGKSELRERVAECVNALEKLFGLTS